MYCKSIVIASFECTDTSIGQTGSCILDLTWTVFEKYSNKVIYSQF